MTRGLPDNWGGTPAEDARPYPADELRPDATFTATRAVSVAAPAATTYRWLCQIAVAPYSYDLVDNVGRRSPPKLTAGTDDLVVGQDMMIFRLVRFTPDHQWTGVTHGRAARIFGDLAITYAAEPAGPDASRLVCRIAGAPPVGGLLGRLVSRALSWGDLVMMRKQLLTLKALAERDTQA